MVELPPGLVSKPEYDLLEAIQSVAFGEIYGAEVGDSDKWIDCPMTPAEEKLIEFIREGAQYIDVLQIHNGNSSLRNHCFQ